MQKFVLLFLSLLIFSFSTVAIAKEKNPATKMVGDLEITVDNVSMFDDPNCGHNYYQCSFGLKIHNKSKCRMQVALMRPISLQLHEGSEFRIRDVSGLANCINRSLKECEGMSGDFEVIDPDQSIIVNFNTWEKNKNEVSSCRVCRISGSLFVHNQETGKSYVRNISLDDIDIIASK